jgi:predicted extracellular nuclease
MKKLDAIHSPGQLTVLAALIGALCAPAFAAAPAAVGGDVVISQVYGGGGNSGATLKQDFVELFNRTNSDINISGWSVQYASATGPNNTPPSWAVTVIPNNTTLGAGKYFLVRELAGAGGTVDVVGDTTGTIAMSATAGKVALVANSTPLSLAAPAAGTFVDLVGFGAVNAGGSEGSPTPATANATGALRKDSGCTDTDSNANDFTIVAPTPRNSGSPAKSCSGGPPPAAPIVASCPAFSVPQGVGGSGPLSATDADSIVNGASITSGAVAGISLGAFSASSAAGQPGTVSLNVASNVAANTYPVGITFTNDGNQTGSCSVNVTVQAAPPPPPPVRTIMDIQGSGAASQYAGTLQTTEGVITFKFAGSGFFIQDPNGDNDTSTSDGIYVFGSTTTAAVGDLVRVTGTVFEYSPAGQPFSYTEIKDATAITRLGVGPAIQPANVVMPTDLGKVQGMLVRFNRPLVINQVSSLGDRGEVTLASVRREVPTNRYRPGTAQALQMAADNEIDQIVLDDGIFSQPNPMPYIGADSTVRAGDSVTDLVGVVDFGSIGNSNNGYKLQPLSVPSVSISRTNPRTTGPDVPGGNVRVASANVLNFFTTFTNGSDVNGATGQGCTLGASTSKSNCRGADNLTEFERQRDKIVNELKALNADVVGLMEIQNNGNTAVSYLVDQLNSSIGFPTYAYVPLPPVTGTDAIRVAMIYKPSVVSLVGAPLSDADGVNNRPPLAQTFKAGNGAKFSVIVNHLKSKGSCPSGTGAEAEHGQGCWNATRVQQAQRLAGYFIPLVKATSGDPDVLVIGDMNSHGFEDPINVLTDAGMVNELERFVRPSGMVYSYVFDSLSGYLDHALASASLDGQMAGATEWHNNADEPDAIDYNTDGKPQDLYVNNAYRASDHDPVVVSLNLAPTFTNVTAGFSTYRSALAMNRNTGQFSGTITFTNTSGAAINGPFQVEFSGLPAGVTLANATGSHNGVSYITAGSASVAPGATVTLTTIFNNPSKGAIPYTATIYSGSF